MTREQFQALKPGDILRYESLGDVSYWVVLERTSFDVILVECIGMAPQNWQPGDRRIVARHGRFISRSSLV